MSEDTAQAETPETRVEVEKVGDIVTRGNKKFRVTRLRMPHHRKVIRRMVPYVEPEPEPEAPAEETETETETEEETE